MEAFLQMMLEYKFIGLYLIKIFYFLCFFFIFAYLLLNIIKIFILHLRFCKLYDGFPLSSTYYEVIKQLS